VPAFFFDVTGVDAHPLLIHYILYMKAKESLYKESSGNKKKEIKKIKLSKVIIQNCLSIL